MTTSATEDVLLTEKKKSDHPTSAEPIAIKRKKSSSIDVIVGAQNMRQTLHLQEEHKKVDEEDLSKSYQTDAHKLTHAQLQDTYKTNLQTGLTTAMHAQLLEEYGPNALSPSKQKPWWLKLVLSIFGGFFNMLLWGGSTLCFIAYIIELQTKGDDADIVNLYLGIVLGVVVCLTGIFSYMQESKSDAIMDSFKSFQADFVEVMRDGNMMNVDSDEIVPGDIIKVISGQNVPCDVVLVECSPDAQVDNSSLTGESDAQSRGVAKSHDEAMETKNLAFFGTQVVRGKFTGMAINTGDNTLMGRIAKLADSTSSEDTPIAKEIEGFVTKISGLAILIAVVFFIILAARLNSSIEDFISHIVFIIGIIVANVPEGLLATVTVSLTLTAKRMAHKNVLVKNLESVETLGSTSVICSDKTGTLTTNIMTVAHVFYSLMPFECDTARPIDGEFDRSNASFNSLIQVAALCSNAAYLADGTMKGDASERAFLKFTTPHVGNDMAAFRVEREKVHEIPFNSANKWQVSVHRCPEGPLVVLKGAPERVLNMCDRYELDGQVLPLTDDIKERITDGNMALGAKGERVLGFAHLPLNADNFGPNFAFGGSSRETANWPFGRDNEEGLIFVGLMAMIDPPRPGVPEAVEKCQSAGIKVIMVTGDHPVTAHAIAKKVGIIRHPIRREIALERGVAEEDIPEEDIHAVVVSGKELEDEHNKSDDSLVRFWNTVLNKKSVTFARTSPQQKLLIVRACQERGGIVAVTGDGVNDSPALKQADIGVAMGITGTDVAKNAADMILLDDNFASIVNGVEEGRIIFDNLKKSIAYTLSSNIPEILPFLLNATWGIPLPLPTVMILLVDLGTDLAPAISMAHEGKEADIMKRPPRDPATDNLVTWRLISFAYLQIGVIQAMAGMYTYMAVLWDWGYGPDCLHDLDTLRQFAPSSVEKMDKNEFLFIGTDAERGDHQYLSNSQVTAFLPDQAIECNPRLNSDTNQLALNCCPDAFRTGATVANVTQCEYYTGGIYPQLNPYTHGQVDTRKEALALANTAYFISIIVVQWADLMICKTRALSIYQQGMGNSFMNFSLIFETILGCVLVYVPFFNPVFTTEPIPFKFWLCGVPFMIVIFAYDELRKAWIRKNRGGWLERTTYW